MPAKRSKQRPLYQRGEFTLDWDANRKGDLRSPHLAIFWYDRERGRVRSTSTGTADVDQAKLKLDIHYLERTTGAAICGACGQAITGKSNHLVADAISTYMAIEGSKRASADAIAARLMHILDYLESLPNSLVGCEAVDAEWIDRFRAWALARPVVGPKGKERPRAASTVENSVIQLRSAISFAHRRGDISHEPKFKAVQPAKINNTPRWRASIAELASMMRYATDGGQRTEALRRFLILSIATLARPDAVMDLSTEVHRGQWRHGQAMLELNPTGRVQTRKYRPVVGVPRQLVSWLETTEGRFVRNDRGPVSSVQSAWATMRDALGLPRECTTKSIRRSMATLLRAMRVPLDQLEMQMGHRSLNATTQIYAPDDPDYLTDSLGAIESIIDEIEKLAPGTFTGDSPDAKKSGRRRGSSK